MHDTSRICKKFLSCLYLNRVLLNNSQIHPRDSLPSVYKMYLFFLSYVNDIKRVKCLHVLMDFFQIGTPCACAG